MIRVLQQADSFQWYLVTQHVPVFLSWMLLERPLLLTQCVNADLHLYYAAIQNLVYGCGNVPRTTAESNNTPPINYAQHVQQSIDMSIQLPTGLQCNPVLMAEVIHQEYILVSGAWLYPRVNVANTVHLSKQLPAELKQMAQKQAS